MKPNLYISIVIATLLSLVVSKIIYFGFTTNDTYSQFSRETFKHVYSHDVYKYRVLCKYVLFQIDTLLGHFMPEKGAEPRLLVLDSHASQRFYLTFYILNTFFLMMTCLVACLLLNLKEFIISSSEKILLLFFIPLIIGLTEFAVTFYDTCSYFLQLLILYIFLRYIDRMYWLTLAGVGLLIILSTINRESSFISVSMISVLLLTRYRLSRKIAISIGAISACFLLTYIGLRVIIIDPYHIYFVNLVAGRLFLDINVLGLLFWILFTYLVFSIASKGESKFIVGLFLFCSLPYIVGCLKGGVLWEVRLYIPIFLGAIFLGRLDFSANTFRVSRFFSRLRVVDEMEVQ
jgi:hypothetical protein